MKKQSFIYKLQYTCEYKQNRKRKKLFEFSYVYGFPRIDKKFCPTKKN